MNIWVALLFGVVIGALITVVLMYTDYKLMVQEVEELRKENLVMGIKYEGRTIE